MDYRCKIPSAERLEVAWLGCKAPSTSVLNKADTVLRFLKSRPGGAGLLDVATSTGIKQPTCHRLLQALATLGYVEQASKGEPYRLGMTLLEYGEAVRLSLDLRHRAYPTMARLAEQTEETVFLTILRGDEAFCVERIPGKHVEVLALQLGGTLPLYLGAAPRCLLASLSDEQIATLCAQPLETMTTRSPKSYEEVRALIEEVRRSGYAISREDVTVGVNAVGAPIYDSAGRTIAALSLSGIVQRIGGEREPEIIELVVQASREMSKSMGFGRHP